MGIRCPHCRVTIQPNTERIPLGDFFPDGTCTLAKSTCPACRRLILYLASVTKVSGAFSVPQVAEKVVLIYPKGASRPPCPPEVPEAIAEDYNEACLVLNDSPKASAALSRRCLQHALRDAGKVKPGNLADEIQQVLDKGSLASQLAESIDAIRHIGNFAAHPIKSQNSSEVMPVEPGEAEWNLDVLEALLDTYYVQPVTLKKKRAALNQKLKEARKPPMK